MTTRLTLPQAQTSVTHIHNQTHKLIVHNGNTITPYQLRIVKRNAHLIKSPKYSSKTTRNDGTEAFQVHFGKTNFAGAQVEKWFYVLNGKALSRHELIDPTLAERKKIKRYAMFYERKGSALLEGKLGDALREWLLHAAVALCEASPETYVKMMELTEPFVCDGQTISLRLVEYLPFTNGTINYVEPKAESVRTFRQMPHTAHSHNVW